MRLAHGRTGWALAAASSLGIGLASAREPLPPNPPAPPVAGKTPSVTLAATEEEGRLAQIKVELAWLTDPLTFPCDLAVRAVAGGVEIGGDVPREEVRIRAVALARQHGKVPVLDKIVVKAGSAPSTTVRPALLSEAVKVCLDKVMLKHPADDNPYNFAIDSSGQVTVSGTALSCEEKLSISRKLSQIRGCTSVVNQFAVKPLDRDGKVFTPITKDNRLVIAGDPAEVMPVAPGFVPPPGIVALPPVGTAAVAAVTPPTPTAPEAPPPSWPTASVAPVTPPPSWPAPTSLPPAAVLPPVAVSVAPPPPAWPADAASVPVGPLTPSVPAVTIQVEAPAAAPPPKPTPVPVTYKIESPLGDSAPAATATPKPEAPVAATLPKPMPAPAGYKIESPLSGSAPTASYPVQPASGSSSPYGGLPATKVQSTVPVQPYVAAAPGASPYGGMGGPAKPATDLPVKPIAPVVQASRVSPYGTAWQPPAPPKPEPTAPTALASLTPPVPVSESPFAHATPAKPAVRTEPKPLAGDLDFTSSVQATPVGPLTPTPPKPPEPPASVAAATPPVAPPSPYVTVKPGTLVQPPPPAPKFVAIVRPAEPAPQPEVKTAIASAAPAPRPEVVPVIVPEATAPAVVIQVSASAPERPEGPPLLPPDESAPALTPEAAAEPAHIVPRPTTSLQAPNPVANTRPTPPAPKPDFRPMSAPVAAPTPPPVEKRPVATQEKPLHPVPSLVPAAPPLSAEHALIARKIQMTCAAKGADVQVRFPDAKTCNVHIRLDNRLEAVRLAQEVMNLPELVPYKVNLDVPKPPAAAVNAAPPVVPAPVAVTPAYAPSTGAFEASNEEAKQQSRIRKQVKKLCADQVEEVHVRFPGAHKAIVQMKPHSEEEGKALADKILALDELDGYEVSLDMPVAAKAPSVVVPEPTVLVAPTPTPAPSKPTVTAVRSVKPAANYPTATVVQAGAKESVVQGEAKPSGAKGKPDPIRLTKRVQDVCGLLAKDVRVEFHGDKECLVHFKARTEGECRLLGEKVLNLAELEPYEVKLEMTIEP